MNETGAAGLGHWLVKYDPSLYARGTLEIDWPWWAYGLAAAALAILGRRLLGYARLRNAGTRWLWPLRAAALALLLLVVLRPRLVVEVDEPARGRVAVLLDDSLSMRIADDPAGSRGNRMEQAFAPLSGEVARALQADFDVDFFRFADDSEPLGEGQRLDFAGPRSDLGRALEQAMKAPGVSGGTGALAAVVVVSDGNLEVDERLDAALLGLRAEGIPLHAVGVGSEHFTRDIAVAAVRMPRRIFAGETVTAEVTLRQRGLSGETLRVRAEEDGILVAESAVRISEPPGQATLALALSFAEPGPRRLAFRIAPLPGENVQANNVVHREIEVRAGPLRILHFEGEPRFEVKFLRRALAQDQVVRLVSLVRTARSKYYRLGVESAAELADGFPDSPEALFRYDALVLGSAEAALLGAAAQSAIRDFVARRGGGLLLLGGRRALSEGGYQRSLLAGMMPVLLEAPAGFRAAVRVRPVDGGQAALGLGLGAFGDLSWDTLPPLTVVNPIRRAKPGASTWLEGVDAAGEPLVVLAAHRYGHGHVAVLAVRDSWRWQMYADPGRADGAHQTLWRGLVRWLARPSRARVQLAEPPQEIAPGQPLVLRAEVLDARFEPLAGASVTLAVTDPLGRKHRLRMQPALDDSQRYETGYIAREPGRYELHALLEEGGKTVRSPAVVLRADPNGREYEDAELDRTRLTELAASTGGRYLPLAGAAELPAALAPRRQARHRLERLPLRDAPILLIGLTLLLCLEWWLRRRHRLR